MRAACDPNYVLNDKPAGYYYKYYQVMHPKNTVETSATTRTEHLIVDFDIGKDIGVGATGADHSSFGLGLRYAKLQADTSASMDGIPDWDIPEGWGKYNSTHHRYVASLNADREFKGAGPTVSWDAAKRLLGDSETGHLDANWSMTGGVLFGKQKTSIIGFEQGGYFNEKYTTLPRLQVLDPPVPVNFSRGKSTTVPLLDLSLGLSYEVQRFKVGAGYRWERYYNAVDGGYTEHKSYDRTIDGPYFKVSVGFGG
jgi:hypothetical protein